MTIKNIMNAVNVSPDVLIKVFQPDGSHEIYRGKYEDAPEDLITKYVENFLVEEFVEKAYRKDVTKVIIVLSKIY